MKREDMLMLYISGTDYSEFLESNSGYYREEILNFKSKVVFSEDLINEIKLLDEEKYFLAVAEPWCENCVINVTMLEVASAINDKIKYKIVPQVELGDWVITFGGSDGMAIPIIIEISSMGEVMNIFSEKPDVLRRLETGSSVMRTVMNKKYREGGLAEEIVREILKL